MKRSLAIVAAAALLGGCGHSPTASDEEASPTESETLQFANWPVTLNNFRFKWTADPGIDLTTGASVLIRAYLESYIVAEYTFDLNNVYPGFLRATPPNMDRYAEGALLQFIGVRPLGVENTKTPQDARPHYGYVPNHVLELRPIGDGYEALVCSAEYASYVESANRPGKFISIASVDKTAKPYRSGPASGVFVYRIEFTQHDPRVGLTAPQPPTARQEGPSPAPIQDVFGNWFVTAESTKFWGPVGQPDQPLFPTPELQQRCADSMPQNEAERTEMMTGYKDAPPPHGEAIPGWPAESK